VTACTHHKQLVFGMVAEGEVVLNEAGKAVERCWTNLAERFSSVRLDTFVVMPNHIHGIIRIVRDEAAARRGAAGSAPTLAEIVRAFKSISAHAVNLLLSMVGTPLWQRNYFERVIRNDDELGKIREYISTNPLRWASDRENPSALTHDDTPWCAAPLLTRE
jgi:REP-associated tyrosine transposase